MWTRGYFPQAHWQANYWGPSEAVVIVVEDTGGALKKAQPVRNLSHLIKWLKKENVKNIKELKEKETKQVAEKIAQLEQDLQLANEEEVLIMLFIIANL